MNPLTSRRLRAAAWWAVGGLLSACGGGNVPQAVSVDFASDASRWTVGASDYQAETAPSDVSAVVADQGAPLRGQGLRIAGTNHSDDLFVYVWRPVDGLEPGQRYRAHWTLQVVAEVPAGCMGVGGAPGEGVTIKAGAASRQPATVVVDGEYLFNQDKGAQTQGGAEAVVLGDLTSTGTDCVAVPPELKTLSGAQPGAVRADAQGRAWLWVGTDSGHEAGSHLNLVSATVVLTPR